MAPPPEVVVPAEKLTYPMNSYAISYQLWTMAACLEVLEIIVIHGDNLVRFYILCYFFRSVTIKVGNPCAKGFHNCTLGCNRLFVKRPQHLPDSIVLFEIAFNDAQKEEFKKGQHIHDSRIFRCCDDQTIA